MKTFSALLLECSPALNEHQIRQPGRALIALGCQAVVMKAGHLPGWASTDWLISPDYELRFDSSRIATRHTHGTGCALSAALAAERPRYDDWPYAGCKSLASADADSCREFMCRSRYRTGPSLT